MISLYFQTNKQMFYSLYFGSVNLELKVLQEKDGLERESTKLEPLHYQTEDSMPIDILR